ncbi:MAG: hypothetical protein FWF25_03555 [Propionibacteriaceae bacterium]|nr:hypothetical protein [Propionibacteriaceae bacterium]
MEPTTWSGQRGQPLGSWRIAASPTPRVVKAARAQERTVAYSICLEIDAEDTGPSSPGHTVSMLTSSLRSTSTTPGGRIRSIMLVTESQHGKADQHTDNS